MAIDINNTLRILKNSGLSQNVINKGLNTVDSAHTANAVVSANLLKTNSSKITIKPELIEKLAYIKSTIDKQKGTGKIEELPFVMLGHKDSQGNTIITDIVYDQNKFENQLEEAQAGSLETASADFSGRLTSTINSHLSNKDIENPVVIHGHTHPQHLGVSSNLTTNFSLADMNAYQDLSEQVSRFNPNASIMGMVVNEIGDFNTVEYDTNSQTFNKFTELMVGEDKLPSFSQGRYLATEQENVGAGYSTSTIAESSGPVIQRVTKSELEAAGYTPSSYYIPPKDQLNSEMQTKKSKTLLGAIFGTLKGGLNRLKSAFLGVQADLIIPDIKAQVGTPRAMATTNFGEKLARLKAEDERREAEARQQSKLATQKAIKGLSNSKLYGKTYGQGEIWQERQ